MRSRYLLPLGIALALVFFGFSLIIGIHQGTHTDVYADDMCQTDGTAGCIFYECDSMDTWSDHYAVEYDFLALPWLVNASSSTRERRMSWYDTSIGGTSWPPMTISASWFDGEYSYVTKSITVAESGTVTGDTGYLRLWKLNSSVSLCDGYGGTSQKAMISTENGSCIGNVYYHVDVIDQITSGMTDYCLAEVAVQTNATSALQAKNAQTCPSGTSRTYVGADPLVIECRGISVVPWNYEIQ